VKHLQPLKRLAGLWLNNTSVGDAGLSHLQGLSSLQRLSVCDTKVSASGLAKLQKALPACEITWNGGIFPKSEIPRGLLKKD
jgi:hypothetical protein